MESDELLIGNGSGYRKWRIFLIVSIILAILLVISVIVNIILGGFISFGKPSSSMQKCSYNGIYYQDIDSCQCFQCYIGTKCENKAKNCVILAGTGQPFAFLEYWDKNNEKVEPISIDIDYRVGYQYFPSLPFYVVGPFDQSFEENLPGELNQMIRRFHKKYGNVADIDNKYLLFGVGATQLTDAAAYAFSEINKKQYFGFAKKPYYFGYPSRCYILGTSRCIFNTSEDLIGDDVFEYVTVPNNPDGFIRTPFYNTTAWMYDLVYYWPHLAGNIELKPLDAPVIVFSLTKLTGHAATRFGWAFVKDKNLATQMFDYILASSVGASIESLYRTKQIFTFLNDKSGEFFDWGKSLLEQRWTVFEQIFDNQPHFIIKSQRNTQYAWIEGVNKSEEELKQLFIGYDLSPELGSEFGVLNVGYIRFNLLEFEGTFQTILENLQKLMNDLKQKRFE